ncbi:MAG TPA: adenylosuccinate lyase family protein [Kofleriaceae bacterium]|jgi:adenylosuccinate lyase|nr:adenylosuccinate lyase family protein [Kofleriaceae bacterium]
MPAIHSHDLPRRCRHDRSHVVDSAFHRGGYSTPESRRIFCDVCRLQRWLDIEVALALSQAEMDMIPYEAAHIIARAARIDHLDLEAISAGIVTTGHSLVPLLRALERATGGYAAQFIHHGATTQDIQDTGQSLEMRDVLDQLERDVLDLLDRLDVLAVANRDQLTVGRTHAQPALPTTFGLKVAGWIDELTRHVLRLREARPRLLVAQLAGGVGTMASFRGQGPALLARFAARLGLEVPDIGWHVARDRFAEFVYLLALIAGSLARAADEIRTLCRPEFAELEERWDAGRLGSSTMPHKRNPENAEQVVVLARLARAQVSLGLESMIVEHERDYRGTRLEWPALMSVSHYTLTALALTRVVVDSITVRSATMERTARELADLACTEALTFLLGQRVGQAKAFAIVHRLAQDAIDRKKTVRECALASHELGLVLEPSMIEQIFEPTSYLGSAGELVDRVLATRRKVCAAPADRLDKLDPLDPLDQLDPLEKASEAR